VATVPKAVVGHYQVEDQAPAPRCVLEVIADLHVAAPLACVCRYAVLRAARVSAGFLKYVAVSGIYPTTGNWEVVGYENICSWVDNGDRLYITLEKGL
jgi:hypothetical protein